MIIMDKQHAIRLYNVKTNETRSVLLSNVEIEYIIKEGVWVFA